MAKFGALARPVVIQMPRRAPGRIRRVVSRAVRHVRRHGARAIPTTAIAMGGAVVGYLQGSGRLDFLPEIGGSKMVTLGLAGYAATRMSRNAHVRSAGLAALAAAAFDFGRVQGGGTSGDDDWGWNT